MQNPLENKIKIRRFSRKDYLVIVFLILVSIALTLSLIYLEANFLNSRNGTSYPISNSSNNNERFWIIEEVKAIGGKYDLELTSNIGNIRRYDGATSYGISNDRKMLAINTQTELKIFDLDNDSFILADLPPKQFSGSIGDSISWNRDSELFAMNVIIQDSENSGEVWIFNKDGSFLRSFSVNPARSLDGVVSSVQFSPFSDLILVAVFNDIDMEDTKEDGSQYSILELPVYLKIFDFDGNVVEEFMIRDFDLERRTIYYKWDKKYPDTINYYVAEDAEMIDINQDYLFNKKLVNGRE